MKRILFGLTALVLASPTLAGDAVLSDGAVIREFAKTTAEAAMPNGADAVLMFEHDQTGQLTVTGLAMVPEFGGQVSAPDSTLAMLRSRSSNSEKKQRPDAEDRRFAGGKRFPVYILGKWKSPAVLWEIDPTAKPMRFRPVAVDGTPGTWTDLPD